MKKYTPKRMTVMITTVVVAWTSLLLGKVTFRISLRTSERKPCMRAGNCVILLPWSSRVIVTAFAIGSFLMPPCYSRLPNLAGAEGFEPPSPVLETGSLAVELTPLFLQGLRSASLLRPHALLALIRRSLRVSPSPEQYFELLQA